MRTCSSMLIVLALGTIVTVGCKKAEAPAPAPKPPTPQAAAPPPAAAPAPPAAVPFKVVQVDLGKEIGSDKKVTQPAAAFAPTDTIYASVLSEGTSPSVELKARWTYEDGQLVNESAQAIAPTGPSATEFHIAKPSGWPTGKYKVEISSNGAVVASKDFAVN